MKVITVDAKGFSELALDNMAKLIAEIVKERMNEQDVSVPER